MVIEREPHSASMFWCCVYAVQREQTLTLAYGYAVAAQAPARQWAPSVVCDGGGWQLRKFTCFLSEADLREFSAQLPVGRICVSSAKGPIEIDTPNLRPRPAVYAVPRTLISIGSPQSFSEELATVESYWCVAKGLLIERLFPEAKFKNEKAREATMKLFRDLQHETSVNFLGDEAGRFGNFEIVRYASGDVRKSDGLCCVNSHSDGSLIVSLEPPLAVSDKISVNCRMFNGGGKIGRTCILDELRDWKAGDRLHFSPQEVYSEFEVFVWRNGTLVAQEHQSILRSVSSNLTIAGPQRRNITKWSQGFPEHLRARAENAGLDTRLRLTTKVRDEGEWPDAELEAEGIVGLWRSSNEGRFFANAQVSTLDAIEFLADQIRQPGVARVTIADPFFDRIGVESLLTRLGDVKQITVLTSHVGPEGTAELKDACEACRGALPKKLEVINVESPGATTQQFHDRYIVIYSEAEAGIQIRTVWMLSNSLSSFAKRYPLVVTPLSQDVANRVVEYVELLKSGRLPDRADLRTCVLWSNDSRSTVAGMVPTRPIEKPFPGWKTVLGLLVPDSEADSERGRRAVANGLLAADTPEMDWHVPSAAIPTVIRIVKAELSTNAMNRGALLAAISHWAYHGGPAATEYGFSVEETSAIRDLFAQHLIDRSRTSQLTYDFSPLRDAVALAESLEQIRYLLNHPSRNGATPELFFFAEALWEGSPQSIVELLEAIRDFTLFCWVGTEGHTRNESRIRSLLKSQLGAVQALGVLMLQDLVESEASAYGDKRLIVLASKLAECGLPPPERLFAVVFLSAFYTRPTESRVSPFEACASLWLSRPFSDLERNRVTHLIDRAAPNRAIPMVKALADECPLAADATGFRSWCLDRLRARLPLKPAILDQPEIRIVEDEDTLIAAAQAAWLVYGTATPTWFDDEIIKKLDVWEALKPLLRARNYSDWNNAVEKLLVATSFGLALAEAAPDVEGRTNFRMTAAPGMADVLLKLGPEFWHHFPDFSGRLVRIVMFLGNCADLSLGDKQMAIQSIVANDGVPSMWKLVLILHSATLTDRYGAQALSMAATPTTPRHWCRSLKEIAAWADFLVTAAKRLADAHAELHDSLQRIIGEITRWRESFELARQDRDTEKTDQ